MFPQQDGSLIHQYTIPYAHLLTESNTLSIAYTTFVPTNLCEYVPLQPGKSHLRVWTTKWLSADQGPTWRDVLRGGLVFNTTVDDASQPYPELAGNLPYVFSEVPFIGSAPAVQGGVPNGYGLNVFAVMQRVPPAIEPVPGGNGLGCAAYVSHPESVSGSMTAPTYCDRNP